MAHCDAREGKWRGNWRMEWEVSTLHTTSEYGVSSITIANAYTSATNSRPNWRPCRFKWTRQFRRKTKSGFCACAITFQTQSTIFFDITTQTAWSSGGKKKLLNTKYVFLFSLQLLSYTILILRIILGEYDYKCAYVFMYSTPLFWPDFNETWRTYSADFRKMLKYQI